MKQESAVGRTTDTASGTTTNSYADALDWFCVEYPHKTIMLKNTDAANALKYKCLTYAYYGGNEYEEVSETTLAAGNIAQINLDHAYAEVKIQLKSSVDDSHATYRIDFVGNS